MVMAAMKMVEVPKWFYGVRGEGVILNPPMDKCQWGPIVSTSNSIQSLNHCMGLGIVSSCY